MLGMCGAKQAQFSLGKRVPLKSVKGKPKLNLACPLNENLMPLEMNEIPIWE